MAYAVTPAGVTTNWQSFQAERDQYGTLEALAHLGASPLAVDDMESIASCASGPVVCRPYDLAHDFGGMATTLTVTGVTATAAVNGVPAGSLRVPTPTLVTSLTERLKGLALDVRLRNAPSTPFANVTTAGSRLPNFEIGVTFKEFARNLKEVGYTMTTTKDGASTFVSGNKQYTYYANSRSGPPTVQVKVNGVVRAKLRLKAV